jgi:hypothetical protein
MGSQPPGEVVSLLSVQRRSRYTLAGTFDTISHADGLAVPDRCFHSDTEAFIGIILEMRHGGGFGSVGSLLTAEEGGRRHFKVFILQVYRRDPQTEFRSLLT